MNYYERIQKSINYIEENLENKINIDMAAQNAYMSQSNYYRMFFAIVGYSVKEYIRHRRIALSAIDIAHSDMRVIDIALKYDFSSADGFSRAFKRVTGFLPSEFRDRKKKYNFERVDIMDKYFDIQDKELLEKYPDIKVLKELEPLRVAYYCYYGKEPEDNAFSVIIEWLNESGISLENTRIFGYNNPSPASPDQEEYGYEVCVTIDDNVEINHKKIQTKVLEGGLYAITSVKRTENEDMGLEIMKTWSRLSDWLKESKYAYGGHQWLEEHLGFDEDNNHIGGIDIYMPIIEEKNEKYTIDFEDVEPMWTATYTSKGKNAVEEVREYFFKWAQSKELINEESNNRIFAYYNHEKMGQDDFFYKIHITVDKEFKTDDTNIKFEEFNGGHYATMKTKYRSNGWTWGEFIKWISRNKKYCFADYWFFEEYLINKPVIEMETDMVLYMPVKMKK